MNAVETAIWEVHQVLTELELPYAIIGGTAVQVWGEPRFTQDLDLTILAPIERYAEAISSLLDHFAPRIDDASDFARRNRVLLVQTSNAYPVDISFGLPGYEDEVMRRAVQFDMAPGKAVQLCSAEDLIIHKAIAGRVQDERDIEGVVIRHHDDLNLGYLRRWLAVFAELLENSEVVDRFERPWRKHQTTQ